MERYAVHKLLLRKNRRKSELRRHSADRVLSSGDVPTERLGKKCRLPKAKNRGEADASEGSKETRTGDWGGVSLEMTADPTQT